MYFFDSLFEKNTAPRPDFHDQLIRNWHALSLLRTAYDGMFDLVYDQTSNAITREKLMADDGAKAYQNKFYHYDPDHFKKTPTNYLGLQTDVIFHMAQKAIDKNMLDSSQIDIDQFNLDKIGVLMVDDKKYFQQKFVFHTKNSNSGTALSLAYEKMKSDIFWAHNLRVSRNLTHALD